MKDNKTFTNTGFSTAVDHYYYGEQLRNVQLQVAALFDEMYVSVGKNDRNRQTDLVAVPVKIASYDRVVAAIKSNHNQNTPLRLPVMAIEMTGLEFAYDRFHGLNTVTRKTTFKRGGVLPDNGKVVYKVMPMPYSVDFDVNIMTSNQKHMHEILEQIMILFTPNVQIQTSDTHLDWTALTYAELTGITYSTVEDSNDGQPVTATVQFRTTAYISAPANVRDNYIKKIKLRIEALQTAESFDEYYLDDEAYITVADVNELNIPPR